MEELPDPNYFGGGLRPGLISLPPSPKSSVHKASSTASLPTFTFEEQDVANGGGMGEEFSRKVSLLTQISSPFSALIRVQPESELVQEVATQDKYICRIQNRFGALEPRLLCVGELGIKLLPTQEPSTGGDDAEEDGSGNPSNSQDQNFVHNWDLPRRDLLHVRMLGPNGCWAALVSTLVTAELYVKFDTPAWRNHFCKQCQTFAYSVVRSFPGGEDCVWQEVIGSHHAQEHRASVIKGLANTQYPRTFSFHFADRQLLVFRSQDLFDGQVLLDSSIPFQTLQVSCQTTWLEVKSTKLQYYRARLVVDAQNSLELGFSSWIDRERFYGALQTMILSIALGKLPVALPAAKTLRQTWKEPKKWFSSKRSLLVGTFNVGDASAPSSEVLELWINTMRRTQALQGSTGILSPRCSMYVLGLQECNKFEEWTRALHSHIGLDYVLVGSVKLWEIGLLVFALPQERISNVETNSVATGRSIAKEVTGVQLGNKGGVGLALKWNDSHFCFINCHLSPHQEKARERCANFIQIVSKLGLGQEADLIASFDQVIVLGDLNFRVDETFPKVVSLSSQAKFSALIAMDQLTKEFANPESCFHRFTDVGPIHFPPTYRWEKGRQAFSNKRDQPPSYTDRILVNNPSLVQCLTYSSSQDCMISDHRPVAAALVVELKEPHTQWPYHPLVCQMKRDWEIDSGSEDLLGGGRINGKQFTVPVASPHAIIRKTSKQQQPPPVQLLLQERVSGPHLGVVGLMDSKVDQDEEDEPVGPFLGEFGSYLVSQTMTTMEDTLPCIELIECNLKLAIGVPTNREAYLRPVCPRLIWEDQLQQPVGEATTMYQVEFLWPNALKAKPVVFDPSYLSSQHLLIAIEHRQAAVATVPPPPVPYHQPAMEEVGLFDQMQPAAETTAPRKPARTTNVALTNLRRNIPGLGSQSTPGAGSPAANAASAAAAATASTTTVTATTSSPAVVVGYISIPLRDIALAATSPVFVSSLVTNNLSQVGTFEGKLRVSFGKHEDQRKYVTSKRQQPIAFCHRTFQLEVLLAEEAKWKRVFVGVDHAGLVYVSLKLPSSALLNKPQQLGDFLHKNASWICDASLDLTKLEPSTRVDFSNDSKPCVFELTGRMISSSSSTGLDTISLACVQDSTMHMLQSVLVMFARVKRYSDKDFYVELQHQMKERIHDRARRRELELEIQRKNAELAKKQLELKEEATATNQLLQPKPSFISRVLLNRKASWFVKAPTTTNEEAPSVSPPTALASVLAGLPRSMSQRGLLSHKVREETVEAHAQATEETDMLAGVAVTVVGEPEDSAASINARLRERARKKFAASSSAFPAPRS